MTGMKHAIEQAARILALTDDYDGCFERIDAWEAASAEQRECGDVEEPMASDEEDCEFWRRRARALAETGLLAPAPLREEQRSEHTVRETAAYFARRVQRVGDRISDRDYRRSLVDIVALEGVQGFLDRIARDDLDVYAVNPAEGDGRADQ